MKNKKIFDWWSGTSGGDVVNPDADVWASYRADTFTGSPGSYVLTDRSGNGRDMTQAAGTLTAGTAANGQAQFTGNATARLTSAATIKSWPITVIAWYRRTAGATCGFFGHQGATPTNTLWMGFESVDRVAIYNNSSTLNTVTDAGADACFIGRIGYGSRVSFINGVAQITQQLATIVQTALTACSVGTEYRGLACALYEMEIWDRELSQAEIDYKVALGNSRYLMSVPLISSYPTVDLCVDTGDSECSGRASRGASDANVPAEYLGAQNTRIWYGTPASNFGTSWDVYNLASNNTQLNDQFVGTSTSCGADIAIGKEYNDRTSNLLYILKSSTGSSGLSKIGANGFYDPFDNSLTQINSTRCYGSLVKNYWRSFAALQATGSVPTIKGIIIWLGTNDAVDLTAATNFGSQLIAFANQLRRELGVSSSQAKIFLMRTKSGLTGATHEALVRSGTATAQAAITNSEMIDTDSYPVFDGVHFSMTGNVDIGTLMAGKL